jgi:hypothetical protein
MRKTVFGNEFCGSNASWIYMEVLVLFEKIYLKPPIPFSIFMPKNGRKWTMTKITGFEIKDFVGPIPYGIT